MIKKYLVECNSLFHQSIMLPFFEQGNYGFHIEGLNYDQTKELFSADNIKYVKKEMVLPSKIVVCYLDEKIKIKAMVLQSSTNKFYLFKADSQKEDQLNINQKYISNDLDGLLEDYEKHCKTKGKSNYDGIGAFDDVRNIDYFEHKYSEEVKAQIDKNSCNYRLLFQKNNSFTVDFVYLVKNKIITISNSTKLDPKVLSLSTMDKLHTERNDCLLINSETREIEYFIFTYRPHLINHYYLFKNLGNDVFEFFFEDISFNKILASQELKNIKYKKVALLPLSNSQKCDTITFLLSMLLLKKRKKLMKMRLNNLN